MSPFFYVIKNYSRVKNKWTIILLFMRLYYNSKVSKYKRFHKFGFGKNNLKKRFPNLDYTKTEKELTTELGYDRIWDCGLFKYELKLF